MQPNTPHQTNQSVEHDGIGKIGRLVLYCALALSISAALLVFTAFQVLDRIDLANVTAERERASSAIDILVDSFGPVTEDNVGRLGKLAGLREPSLTRSVSDDPDLRQIPMLVGQGPSGSYLTWRRTISAEAIFQQFAPIRLPIIGIMTILVLGFLLRIRILVREIDKQRRLAQQQSLSDPLTGLANRLALDVGLERLDASATPFAVLALDLDDFKQINDKFGHAAGDEVLRTVAARLTRLIGPTDLLARMGGDEFVLICTSRTGQTALTELARDCIEIVERPIHLPESSVNVGISLGIVPAGTWHKRAGSLMVMADEALYLAKTKPGSGFRFSGPESLESSPLPRPFKISA